MRSLLIGTAFSALLLASATPAFAAVDSAAVSAGAGVVFDVHLPLQRAADLDALIALQGDPTSPYFHHFLTPAQFRASFGPSSATVERASAILRGYGLSVVGAKTESLHVRGTAQSVERAFGTHLATTRDAQGHTSIATTTRVSVPTELASLGATVIGLSQRIKPQPLVRRSALARPENRYSPLGSYWFDDLKQAYDYPSYGVANGKGVTIATVGLSDYSTDDALLYFQHEKLGPNLLAPTPKLGRILLPGASPFDPNAGVSDEANLDVQQSAGSAPGATVIGVDTGYVGNGDAFYQAYAYLDDSNVADIVSTSYGQCELYYTAAYNGGTDYTGALLAYHDLFRQGNAQGITFIFSSGDGSGLDCYPLAYFGPGTGKTYGAIPGAGIWVDDPNATGVGGTNLVTTSTAGSLTSKYVSENEIGDRIDTPLDFYGTGNMISGALWGSGGGVSTIFKKPGFQRLVATGSATQRTVPDVSMHMGGCPFYGPGVVVACSPGRDSSDIAAVGGNFYGFIGTSASAPEFAGLLAVKESVTHTRYGNANNDIYTLAARQARTGQAFFHQGQNAYNGVVRISKGQLGYNTIVGVGTPIAQNYLYLPLAIPAGDPQTATNP